MKNAKLNHLLLVILVMTLGITACKKDKENAEETITTIELSLTGGGTTKKYVWEDKEGDGNSTIDTIKLSPLTTYTCAVRFLDRSSATETDITPEVLAEGTAHMVWFKRNALTSLSFTQTDTDANQNPIGLSSVWSTTSAGSGPITILLIHEPDKSLADPSTSGEIDIEGSFPVVIQ